jgi:steroid delta-isomerase-like uncharacterized protein
MSTIVRRSALIGCSSLVLAGATASAASKSVAQKWIDGWNATSPDALIAAFTPDATYEDVAFGLKKTGSAGLRELHQQFHASVGGMYLKLVTSHIAGANGTIEWLFGGKDVGLFKTGKPFEVRGVSVIEVRGDRIANDRDYYNVATIMKQVGVLPAS